MEIGTLCVWSSVVVSLGNASDTVDIYIYIYIYVFHTVDRRKLANHLGCVKSL